MFKPEYNTISTERNSLATMEWKQGQSSVTLFTQILRGGDTRFNICSTSIKNHSPVSAWNFVYVFKRIYITFQHLQMNRFPPFHLSKTYTHFFSRFFRFIWILFDEGILICIQSVFFLLGLGKCVEKEVPNFLAKNKKQMEQKNLISNIPIGKDGKKHS